MNITHMDITTQGNRSKYTLYNEDDVVGTSVVTRLEKPTVMQSYVADCLITEYSSTDIIDQLAAHIHQTEGLSVAAQLEHGRPGWDYTTTIDGDDIYIWVHDMKKDPVLHGLDVAHTLSTNLISNLGTIAKLRNINGGLLALSTEARHRIFEIAGDEFFFDPDTVAMPSQVSLNEMYTIAGVKKTKYTEMAFQGMQLLNDYIYVELSAITPQEVQPDPRIEARLAATFDRYQNKNEAFAQANGMILAAYTRETQRMAFITSALTATTLSPGIGLNEFRDSAKAQATVYDKLLDQLEVL